MNLLSSSNWIIEWVSPKKYLSGFELSRVKIKDLKGKIPKALNTSLWCIRTPPVNIKGPDDISEIAINEHQLAVHQRSLPSVPLARERWSGTRNWCSPRHRHRSSTAGPTLPPFGCLIHRWHEMAQPFWKITKQHVSKVLKVFPPFDPAIPLLEILRKKSKLHTKVATPV